ncbi:hypothetical protein Tcan_03151 [Toxocara canis]|uniref:Uncharacterized protein n=1 Tax=Toxocara canis TaxID=6265 RepID=A0A0B2UN98_TOXCA|nr:hypothetical protein Tcan_03151 [Toxocara canis]
MKMRRRGDDANGRMGEKLQLLVYSSNSKLLSVSVGLQQQIPAKRKSIHPRNCRLDRHFGTLHGFIGCLGTVAAATVKYFGFCRGEDVNGLCSERSTAAKEGPLSEAPIDDLVNTVEKYANQTFKIANAQTCDVGSHYHIIVATRQKYIRVFLEKFLTS